MKNSEKIKYIKVGQIFYCEENGGEYSQRLLVTDVDLKAKTVTGRLDYTSSAYGSAVVQDSLERGKIVTVDWKKLTNHMAFDNEEIAEEIKKAAKKRIEYAKNLIESDEQIMQSIDMEYRDDAIDVVLVSTLPTKDEENVPWVCKSWLWISDELTKEQTTEILTERFHRVSSRGKFLPQTKITFKAKSFKFEGTLESGLIVCKGVVPKKLLDAMNLFIEGARSQYGMSTAA